MPSCGRDGPDRSRHHDRVPVHHHSARRVTTAPTTRAGAPAWQGELATPALAGVDPVVGDLAAVHVKPAYDCHRDLLRTPPTGSPARCIVLEPEGVPLHVIFRLVGFRPRGSIPGAKAPTSKRRGVGVDAEQAGHG